METEKIIITKDGCKIYQRGSPNTGCQHRIFYTDFDEIKKIFQQDANFEINNLPGDIFKIKIKNKNIYYFIFLPEKKYSIVWGNSTFKNVPQPDRLWILEYRYLDNLFLCSYLSYFDKTNQEIGEYPVPNIHSNHEVCWGSKKPKYQVKHYLQLDQLFFAKPFNNDLLSIKSPNYQLYLDEQVKNKSFSYKIYSTYFGIERQKLDDYIALMGA